MGETKRELKKKWWIENKNVLNVYLKSRDYKRYRNVRVLLRKWIKKNANNPRISEKDFEEFFKLYQKYRFMKDCKDLELFNWKKNCSLNKK